MSTVLYTHPSFLDHDTGEWHPEAPSRLAALNHALEQPPFTDMIRKQAPLVRREDLLRAHDADHIDAMLNVAIAPGDHHYLDTDTLMSSGSGLAAQHAAGAVIAAIDDVLDGTATNAFCAVRPPGHHAERRQAMGFCLFNNVAVGALYARHVRGLERVAIVDFDVHHGNGTQHILWDEPGILYASIHEDDSFPYTGRPDEQGGKATMINIPLPKNTGPNLFRQAYERLIFPRLEGFMPDLLLLSAGFDAHVHDPMAHFQVQAEDFAWLTRNLIERVELATGHTRVVSVLEGGYDPEALVDCVGHHLNELLNY